MAAYGTQGLEETTKGQKLGIAAATICFLIGFWHTGLGLENYKVLSSEYGGFVFAAGVVILMILAYSKAVRGSNVGLAIYLGCALITFICNLNSFYPNYRSNALIREELREHRAKLADLKESTQGHFKDAKLEGLKADIEAMKKQLSGQINDFGFGPKAKELLTKIEVRLGLPPGKITRKNIGKSEGQWKALAEDYAVYVEDELKAVLVANRYLDKQEVMGNASEYLDIYSQKIDETLASKQSLSRVPPYVEELVKGYRETCKKAVAIALSADKAKPFESCDQTYSSPNTEIGTFSHTFKSAWKTLGDGGTLTVLFICLFLDFVFPLAIYLLVRKPTNSEGGWWILGGQKITNRPTSAI